MASGSIIIKSGSVKLKEQCILYSIDITTGKAGSIKLATIEKNKLISYSRYYTNGDYTYYNVATPYVGYVKVKSDKKVDNPLGSPSNSSTNSTDTVKLSAKTVYITAKTKSIVTVYPSKDTNNTRPNLSNGVNRSSISKDVNLVFTKSYGSYYFYTSNSVTPRTGWIKYTGKLINGSEADNIKIVKNLTAISNESTVKKLSANVVNTPNTNSNEETDVEIESEIVNLSAGATQDYEDSIDPKSLLTDSMRGIYCMPYQFMDIADRRLKGTSFGRKYAEKIVSRMPLLYLTPGRPAFMKGYNSNDKKNLLTSIIGTSKDSGSSAAYDDFLDNNGKYYSMNFAFTEYFNFVNPMLQILSRLMGIENRTVKFNSKYSAQLKNADWSKALSSDFRYYWSAADCIPFYINSATQISESFSNEVGDSYLAGKINGYSEQARELNFILGTSSSLLSNGKLTSGVSNIMEDFKDALSDYASGSASSMIDKIGKSAATIATGGKLVFPQIWTDSSLGRSYSAEFKLRSPDCDNFSLYMNIMVPYIHLLCLTAPQQLGENGYQSPFLIRAFCKGQFNIDMGIITSMDVSKGKEGAWNINGIPTEMDISITIKDLYSNFFITGFDGTTGIGSTIKSIFGDTQNDAVLKMLRNTSMMDYLANMAGLNINKPDISRTIQLYSMLKGSQIKNWPHSKWLGFQQKVDNFLKDLL